MTKRDLLENDVFKSIPDDTEIVFGTNADLCRCVPMNALNLSYRSEEDSVLTENGEVFAQKKHAALVIDAVPYWYLKDAYNMTFKEHEE